MRILNQIVGSCGVLFVLLSCSQENAPSETGHGLNASSEFGLVGCKAPRRYSYAIPGPFGLACGFSNRRVLMNRAIPDSGRALALLRIGVRHTGAGPTHYWTTNVNVGEPIFNQALGDDVCPGTFPAAKPNLGFGTLTEANNRIVVRAYQNSTACNSQALIITNVWLDVWVEDNAEHCRGKSVFFTDSKTVYGASRYVEWGNSMRDILSLQVPVSQETSARVVTAIEGTPHNLGQRCGTENASLSVETRANGNLINQRRQIVPGGPGMSHLVQGTNGLTKVAPGENLFQMRIGKATSSRVTTGGCCGYASMGVVLDQ